jgi:hypothetical protein
MKTNSSANTWKCHMRIGGQNLAHAITACHFERSREILLGRRDIRWVRVDASASLGMTSVLFPPLKGAGGCRP